MVSAVDWPQASTSPSVITSRRIWKWCSAIYDPPTPWQTYVRSCDHCSLIAGVHAHERAFLMLICCTEGLWGRSMGAATAIMYTAKAEERRAKNDSDVVVPSALILDSPFASLVKLIPEVVDSVEVKGQYVCPQRNFLMTCWAPLPQQSLRIRSSIYERKSLVDYSDWGSLSCGRRSSPALTLTLPTWSPLPTHPSALFRPFLFRVSGTMSFLYTSTDS